jgi:hypothetical protein
MKNNIACHTPFEYLARTRVPGGGTRPIDTPRAENGDEESPHTELKVPFEKDKVPKPPTRPPPTPLSPQPTELSWYYSNIT